MQSTGQTSTHDRSFTLMQGSAMMYGIQAPGMSRRSGATRFAPNRKHSKGPHAHSRPGGRHRDPGHERQDAHEERILEQCGVIRFICRATKAERRHGGDTEQTSSPSEVANHITAMT